ncbi:hypothetical protein HY439_01475 [Candidatus Microgenomates bacterium]|nr:hypothetical protein [Candidatus Microgenomates bacterium]
MIYFNLLLFSFLLIFSPLAVNAQENQTTATPTPTPQAAVKSSQDLIQEKVQDLKERVATKVAQIRQLQSPKAIVGEIRSNKSGNLTLATKAGDRTVFVFDETKIYQIEAGRKKTLSVSNLKEGQRASIVGIGDAQGEFLAKTVFVKTPPPNIVGTVEKKDEQKNTLTVKNGKETVTYLIEIENKTKTARWAQGTGAVKSGFSDIKVGDIVHVNGPLLDDAANHVSANRIFILALKTPQPTQ